MPADQLDLDALRALRDPDAAPSDDAVRDARAALLLAIDEERSPTPARRRRRPRLGLIAVAVVAAAGVGGAGYAVFKPSDVSAGVICASTIERLPSGTQAPMETGGARATCARAWARGEVDGGPRRPRVLTACDSGTGAVYVYAAGAGVCRRLGLEPHDDRLSGQEERFVGFRSALTRRVSRRCITLARAEVIAREELGRAGLTGWTIRRGPPAPPGEEPRPCASLSFEAGERRVTLVPMEPFPPGG